MRALPQTLWKSSSAVRASFRPCLGQYKGVRCSSTSAPSGSRSLRNTLYASALVITASVTYVYATDTRSSLHRYLIPPLLRALYPDAEDAHHAAISILEALYAARLHPRERVADDPRLGVTVFGTTLVNPLAISAGFDKDAAVPDALFALGPAIVEVGGITARPQPGNAKPRVFRIPAEEAIVNRYGLNSQGADAVALRLRKRVREFAYAKGYGVGQSAEDFVLDGFAGVNPGSLAKGKLLAIQVAKNKDTPDADIDAVVNDHVYAVDKLGRFADIVVVNVSSPNTPGLRGLQAKEPLEKILNGVVKAANSIARKDKPKVMVKVSPDEDSAEQVQGICEAVWESKVDGIIVGNTTKLRPEPLLQGAGLSPREREAMREQGGFSGPHLFERTVRLVRLYRQILDQGPENDAGAGGAKTIFASGGIATGAQAMEVMRSGADVAMVYTTMMYNGAGTVTRIKSELAS